MKVIYATGKTDLPRPAVVVLGVFDGVHRGHQALIRKAVARARKLHLPTVVVTFHPHPVHVLHPEVSLLLITSLRHRLSLMEELGVDVCWVVRFTKSFAGLSAERFVKSYLVKGLLVREIFVGDDFRFGQNRTGSLEQFQLLAEQHQFKVHVLSSVGGRRKDSGFRKNISSSEIRHLIQSGRLARAAHLLGRPVSIVGEVVRGDGRGKKLGFPTANIKPDHELIPPFGVYAVKLHLKGKVYKGMANIGCRPTFPSEAPSTHIEIHLFDFHRNIYGEHVSVDIIRKIRSEKFFPSLDRLIAQIKKDQIQAQHILR